MVLVVDDDETIVEALTTLLEFQNIDCAGAHDRSSAALMLGDRFYAVILADVRLHTEEDGLRLLDDIQRISPRSRVISMTGFYDARIEAAVLRRGSTVVLQKPMDGTEILSAIAALLTEIEALAATQETEDLDRLYLDVRKVLYSIPQRRYRLTAEEAEDIVQEAWLLFLERRSLIHNNGSWLAGTVTNLSRRRIDASRRSRETFCDTDLVEDLAVVETDSRDDGIRLRAALGGLSGSARNLCTLIAIQGYSYAEVSLLTGLPIGSVGPMYMRAKEKMQLAALQASTIGRRSRRAACSVRAAKAA